MEQETLMVEARLSRGTHSDNYSPQGTINSINTEIGHKETAARELDDAAHEAKRKAKKKKKRVSYRNIYVIHIYIQVQFIDASHKNKKAREIFIEWAICFCGWKYFFSLCAIM